MNKIAFLALALSLLSGASFATESAPLTGGPAKHTTETISTSALTVLAANGARKFLQIQNVGAANKLACTLDGTTPVINGNGVQLGVGGAALYDVYVPTGAVKCIGSAAGTVLTVTYQ